MKASAALIGIAALAALGCAKKPPSLVGLWVLDANEDHFVEFFDGGRMQAVDGSGHWVGLYAWTDPAHLRIDEGLHGELGSPPRIYAVTLTSDRLTLKDGEGHLRRYTRNAGKPVPPLDEMLDGAGKPYEAQRREDGAVADQLWKLIARGDKACEEARFDEAQAEFRKALEVVESHPRFRKSWSPDIERRLIDVRVKRLLYADAEREFKEFKKRYYSQLAARKQLLEEGRAIREKTGTMKVPWANELRMILGWLEAQIAVPPTTPPK